MTELEKEKERAFELQSTALKKQVKVQRICSG